MKRLGKFILCIGLSCMFAFTGCSLVQRNTERYLNRTVATAGDITISKQELIQAYNNYGYQYTQYYGYSADKALKTTIDGIIERKILLAKAKGLIVLEDDGTVSYYKTEIISGVETRTKVATIYNKNVWNNSIWQETFDAVNKQIKSIEDEIKKEQGIDVSAEDKEEDKPEFAPYKEYEKKVEYKNGEYTTIKTELAPAEDKKSTIADFTQEETGDAEISKKAFQRYIKSLELGYKSQNLTLKSLKTVSATEFENLYTNLDLSDKQKLAFVYELERIHTSYEEAKYISTLESLYNEYIQVIDDDFNQKVVNYYKQLVESSYEKYASETDEDGYKAYVTAMQDDISKVYYHKDFGLNKKGEKKAFVAVSHVLIKLSDDQIAQIKALDAKLKNGTIQPQQYDEEHQQILNKTVVYERNMETGFDYPAKIDPATGLAKVDERGNEIRVKVINAGTAEEQEVEVRAKTIQEVYDEINAELSKPNYDTTEKKAVAFNQFIYKYGQDTGMINAEKYYAVNLDTEVGDKMVKPFADEARRLAGLEENGGNLGNPVFVSQDNYSGYHIIFNAGIIKNDLTIEQVRNMDYSDADYLFNKKIMLGTNKTVYDYIYDTIYSSKYSQYTRSIVETAKNAEDFVITYYVSSYKDLY